MLGKREWQNGAMLKFVSDCYKNQKMCNDTVDNYVYALQFVPNCYKTQKMCNKAVDTLASAIQLVPDWCKTQPMCGIVVLVFVFNLSSWNIALIDIRPSK